MGELLLDTVKGVVYVWVTEELPKSTLGVCVKCNNPWENEDLACGLWLGGTQPKSTESRMWSNRKVLHVEVGKGKNACVMGRGRRRDSSRVFKSRIERYLCMEDKSWRVVSRGGAMKEKATDLAGLCSEEFWRNPTGGGRGSWQ